MMDGPRRPRIEELPAVVELVRLVFDDPAGGLLSMPERFPYAMLPENLDNMYALFADGRPVSVMVTEPETLIVGRCRLPVGTLGMVCTHLDHRGRQHAGRVLQAAYDGLRRRGAVVTLISGWRSLYTASGGVRVWPHYEGTIQRAGFRIGDDASLAVERVSAGNRAEWVALHDAEPVRFDWRPAWRDIVLPGLMETKVGTGLLVRRGGRAVAAACVLNPVVRSWPHMLLDWFGERRAAVVAASRLMGELGIERLRTLVVEQDAAMVEALAAAGFTMKRLRPCPWTIKVLDFAGLLAGLGPHLSERLGGGGASISATETGLRVRAGGAEYVTGDEATAARIMFALPEETEETLGGAPAAVRQVLRRVFPVPLRHYGVNYL